MFKAIKEFFMGKPVQQEPVQPVPYKVPEPPVVTPIPVVVEPTPVVIEVAPATASTQITDSVTQAPAKRPRKQQAQKTEKATKAKKPAAITVKKTGRKPKAK